LEAEGEGLYRAARDRELAGDDKAARKAYFTLIMQSPKSAYIPFAYFAFGEGFLRDVERTGNATHAPLAEQSYSEVLRYPAPDNKLYLVASMRLATVHKAAGSAEKARNAFQHALDDSLANPTWDCAAQVTTAARDSLN
jgi:hypothetical protein